MIFLFLFCLIILQVQTTTISREDLQEWKDEILEEIEPIKKRLELYGSSFEELKANVEGIDLKINKLSSEFNQTQSDNVQEELNNELSLQEVISVHCVCQTYFFNRFYVWLSLL